MPENRRITLFGYVMGGLLALVVITGGFLVIRNLDGPPMAAGVIILLDISHLGAVMLFLMGALYGVMYKKKWTNRR